ncbi:MAG: hypothetical protein AAFU82_19535 [Pseudomonadota bacterium]
MLTDARRHVVFAWNFIFDLEVSPLRHIPDVATRHYAFQMLGAMWAVAASSAIGSYTFFAVSLLGHSVLIAAAAITVATFTTVAKKPSLAMHNSGRRNNGEHE